jgi:uncharacterized membrane protein YeaQ/YmgE (transglycosylase-associated protein family)
LIQVIFQALLEIGFHVLVESGRKFRLNQWVAVIGYLFLGVTVGFLSVKIFPSHFIKSFDGQLINMVITPIVAAGAMTLLGAWWKRRGNSAVRMDSFVYAYVFALSMSLVRFWLCAV